MVSSEGMVTAFLTGRCQKLYIFFSSGLKIVGHRVCVRERERERGGFASFALLCSAFEE